MDIMKPKKIILTVLCSGSSICNVSLRVNRLVWYVTFDKKKKVGLQLLQ